MRAAKQVFNKYLRRKGIRYSSQRDKILEAFLKTERHLTANELYEILRKRYPEIGYATVYRALKIIKDAGLAEEIDFGDGAKRYEHKYGHQHHDHLICLKCGKLVEAISFQIEKMQKRLAAEHGFTLMGHKMHLFGICRECGKEE